MTKDFVKGMSYPQLERAYRAYTDLMCIYEDVCAGPYGARQHREYFGIADSRDNIRQRVIELSKMNSHGDGQ